mmetsp:Transcript_23830/g.32645  ORF Transcript_23830/g.32645 Transcript_23830/m.32645 type:complete len:369 (+) Transcript_23830:28-1134(+)
MKFASIPLVVLVIALSLVYLPSFWVGVLLLVDYYTPWVLFESELYDKYHNFIVGRLPERPELPLMEIPYTEASMENIVKLSKGFTWPIVIRGMLGNESMSEGVKYWKDPNWWLERYPDEPVLCGTLSEVVENCTIRTFFNELEHGKPFYISGASVIFDKHPSLHDMIDNELIRDIEPGMRTATQIFMGVPQMGSDIHCAVGVNIFRQVVGEKKWWFIPTSQTAYLKPSINVNGFSAHTHTMVGKEGGEVSPWMNKLERYTSILHPGDVLVNPPWFWHGIVNLGDRANKDLVIGSPSRYGRGYTTKAAFQNNPLFTLNTIITLGRKYGLNKITQKGFRMNLQGEIANNRRDREGKALVTEDLDEFDLAD